MTDDRPTPKEPEPEAAGGRRTALLIMAWDIGAPIGMYYLLHGMGVGTFLALLLSALLPGISTALQVVRSGRLDGLGVFMVSITAASALASLVSGSPRFLLAKDGLLTAFAGAWLLGSAWSSPAASRRPARSPSLRPGGAPTAARPASPSSSSPQTSSGGTPIKGFRAARREHAPWGHLPAARLGEPLLHPRWNPTQSLATAFGDRPVVYHFARVLLEGRVGPHGESWDLLWERLPGFRRIWRVAGIIWGTATLADAGLRFAMAYTMPVNQVPALNGIQWGVLFLLLQVVTNVYYHRAGLYRPDSALYAPVA